MQIKIKRVKKAEGEYATSETVVWWDMDTCPLPNGFDPCLLGPRIDTELKSLGYNGPLTIVACGNLHGIPNEFLRALSSSGFLIRNSIRGLNDMVYKYMDSRISESPMSIMLITTNYLLLNSVVCRIYKGVCVGYNLLMAYPPSFEFEGPHHSSFVHVGGEWLWTRYSLLKVSGVDKTRGLVVTAGLEKFSCEPCIVPSFSSFEDFTEHIETNYVHQCYAEHSDYTVQLMMERDAENLEILKQSKEYNELLESKKVYFEDIYNDYYKWRKDEKEMAKAEMAKAEMAKAEMAKAEMEKDLVIRAASSLLTDNFFYEPWMTPTKADNLVNAGGCSLPTSPLLKANSLVIGDEGYESSPAHMNLKEFEEDSDEDKKKQMMDLRKNLIEQNEPGSGW